METTEKYMHRALQLAQLGLGQVSPNPMVGCVIVHDGRIIGEGYHQRAGENHAEVNAIRSVKNKQLLSQSSLYVTLEPCGHFGKTAPCVDAILQHGIPEVLVGCLDVNPKMQGKSVEKLQKQGVVVTMGVLEDECRVLNKRFFTFFEKKRPYIILKWAETQDGFIDDLSPKPLWITDNDCRALVHQWRTEEDALLVGYNTVLKDNPQLNSRCFSGKNPIRITIDRDNSLPKDLLFFDKTQPTIVFSEKERKPEDNLAYICIQKGDDILGHIVNILHNKNIQSLIIEGGTKILQMFIQRGLWDEARIFVGEKSIFEGVNAPTLPCIGLTDTQIINQNKLYVYSNQTIY